MTRPMELANSYVRITLQSGLLPAEELLAGSGLSEQDLATREFLPWQLLATMFQRIEAVRQLEPWGPALGAQYNITAHGPLGFAALSAPTLGGALEVMGSLYPVRNSTFRAGLEHRDGRFFLWFEDLTGDEFFAARIAQIVSKVVEELLRTILGHPVGRNVHIAFAGKPPPNAESVAASYDARVSFAATRSSISVPATWCALPSPLADEVVYRANLVRCREVIASREEQDSCRAAVLALLDNHFDLVIAGDREPGPPPTLQQAAATLHYTERTLIRHLQAEGCGFRELLEEQRRVRAAELLHDARLQVAEVGELLGYREPANFGRAFRRWFQTSPAAWRRQR